MFYLPFNFLSFIFFFFFTIVFVVLPFYSFLLLFLILYLFFFAFDPLFFFFTLFFFTRFFFFSFCFYLFILKASFQRPQNVRYSSVSSVKQISIIHPSLIFPCLPRHFPLSSFFDLVPQISCRACVYFGKQTEISFHWSRFQSQHFQDEKVIPISFMPLSPFEALKIYR